ncbi:hypothetical protein [Vibrio sinaloensis]|uniref:hypothetical protein n=1 Tax=Photobacterium sp. (strain ATCC 43367) TaxID=379097 RepID=UPI00204D15F8|nr:hypothetical protein [Vibrio sinaloensis]UPQ89161.1 hypothetical protein MTO69_06435 [Vibrio sinaloensis]
MNEIFDEYEALLKTTNRIQYGLSWTTSLSKANFLGNSKLLNLISSNSSSSLENSYQLKAKPIPLRLEHSSFVSTVEIQLKVFLSKKLVVTYETVSGEVKSVEQKVSTDAGSTTIVVNNFIKSISFSSPDGELIIKGIQIYSFKDLNLPQKHRYKLTNQIKSLQVASARIKNLGSAISRNLTQLEQKSTDLDQAQEDWKTTLADLTEDEKILKERIKQLEKDCRAEEIAYEKAEAETQSITEELKDSKAALLAAREETDTLSQSKADYENEIKNLKMQYADQKATLRELEKDIDVFSEDLKDYTKETRLQTFFYGGLAFSMICIIVVVTVSVLSRSTELISLFDKGKIESVIDVILSRIPFTLAVLAILTLCGEGLRRCVNRLIDIHDQRLSFYRISIAARDITDVSYESVEVSRDELVKTRLETKMKLLRLHMQKDLARNNEETKAIQ